MDKKLISILISLLIAAVQACTNSSAASMTPSLSSTPRQNETEPAISASTQTSPPSPASHPTLTLTPAPAWAADFAEPILAAIKDQPPSFQDDFTYSYGNGWYVGYMGYPTYLLTVENGVLIGKTEDPDKGCQRVSNQAMAHPDFVLQVDLPENTGDIAFHSFVGGGPSYFFWVQPQAGGLEWRFGDQHGKQQTGVLEKSDSSNIAQALLIKNRTKAAFYLNQTPLAYLEDPVLAEPIHGVLLRCGYFDNLKFWNLDRIPSQP